MKNNIKITVIVPCYNGEKYIKHFFEKINNQTFKEFEVIIIDDYSQDKSKELIKKYSRNKTKLIEHSQNYGAGYSRNEALKKAQGKYISFIDIDDDFDLKYLEILYEKAKENYDIINCTIKSTLYDNTYEEGIIEKGEILKNPFAAAAWGKLIKKDIISNNMFAEGIINEDIPAIIGAIVDAKEIYYTNKTFYEYRINQNSVQSSSMSEKKFDVFKAYKILKERKNIDKYLEIIEYNQLITFFIYMILEEKNNNKRLNYIKRFYDEYNNKIMDNNYFIIGLNKHNKLNRQYYKLIVYLCDKRMYKLANLIIEIKNMQNIVWR